MKKACLFLLVLCLCLFICACGKTETPVAEPSAAPDSEQPSARPVPDALQELVENENTQWLAGMWVTLTNTTYVAQKYEQNVEVYQNPGAEISAEVVLQSGLNKEQSFFLLVLADGVPIEFTIEGERCNSYPVTVGPLPVTLNLTLTPEFSLNMGRLDFVMCFAEDPQSDFHTNSYTVWIAQEKAALSPNQLQNTVPQRNLLKGAFNSGIYSAWLWQGQPGESDFTGPRALNLTAGEPLVLEAIASKAGTYRIALIAGDQSATFTLDGREVQYFDWESTGDNMLQTNITLPAFEGSFFTIATLLDTQPIEDLNYISGGIRVAAAANG